MRKFGIPEFTSSQPTLVEVKVAKNYLNQKELRAMGQIVSGYLDFAEHQTANLNRMLTTNSEQLPTNAGSISHE